MAKKLSPEALDYFKKQGAKGGKLSAKQRMEKLTPEQRSEIARNAATKRWEKKKPKKKASAQTPHVD